MLRLLLFSVIGATLLSSVSAKKSCYTLTTTVPADPSCLATINCAPVLQCLRLETATLTLPPPDPSCKKTKTVTKTASCACETGCPTTTTTVTASASTSTPAGAAPFTSYPGYVPVEPLPTTSTLVTQVLSSSCFTLTATYSNPACPPFNTESAGGCFRPACVVESQVVVPATREGCPVTPTVTRFSACQTACPSGCNTFVTTVTRG